MFIKKMVLEGMEGDVVIDRDSEGPIGVYAVIGGAVQELKVNGEPLRGVPRHASEHFIYEVAEQATKVLVGTDNDGTTRASVSMITDVSRAIQRVMGIGC